MGRTIVGAAVLAVALWGCAGKVSEHATGAKYEIAPLPKNYKEIVADYLKARAKNRGAVRVGNAYQDSCLDGGNIRHYAWAVPVYYEDGNRARTRAPQDIIWFNHNSVQMISDRETGYCGKA